MQVLAYTNTYLELRVRLLSQIILFIKYKLRVAQLVGFLVVEPAHSGSSPQFDTGARNFLDLF
jgi:hypothetical protein